MPVSAGDVTTVTLQDPARQMTAGTMQIPAGWKFQGAMIVGSRCDITPHAVFRAYSPDGLSEMRGEPPFEWSYSSVPGMPNKCPSLTRTMNATEFLNYYRGVIGARYIGPMSVAPSLRQAVAAGIERVNGMHPGHTTGDIAAERVEAKNGTFTIEEQIRAAVRCNTTPIGKFALTQCIAFVLTARAPKGKLDALVSEINADNLPHVQLTLAYQQQIADEQNAIIASLQEQGRRDMAASAQRLRDAYEQSTAALERNHQQFMAQMNASFESSQRNAISAMNERSTAASDWADYSLDQQTVTGSGGLTKVSNAYAHTWSNGQGQWYQTNYPNENPNGVLPGNWSQQTVVHGNGTPK